MCSPPSSPSFTMWVFNEVHICRRTHLSKYRFQIAHPFRAHILYFKVYGFKYIRQPIYTRIFLCNIVNKITDTVGLSATIDEDEHNSTGRHFCFHLRSMPRS